MDERVSDRLIDQRLRNRIMEAVLTLAEGDAGVREVGFTKFFEDFYDWIPHHSETRLRDASRMPLIPKYETISSDEEAALADLLRIVDDACDATPGKMSETSFIATGWPARIQVVAQKALSKMLARGRFREDIEEDEPSDRSWPYGE